MLVVKNNWVIRDAAAADAPQLGIWWRDGRVMAHAGFPLGLPISDEKIGFRNVGERHNSWKNQRGEMQSAVDHEMTKAEYFSKYSR